MKNFILILLFAALYLSCGRNAKMVESASAESENSAITNAPFVDDIEVLEFTFQYTVPGMESVLRGTQNFNLSLNINFEEPTRIKYLHVDSVLIPIKYLLIDGNQWQVDELITGKHLATIKAFRNIYSTSGTYANGNAHKKEYARADSVMNKNEGGLLLSSLFGCKETDVERNLGEYTKLDRVYRP